MAEWGLSPVGFVRSAFTPVESNVHWRVSGGGPDAPYWYYVENGTSKMTARPFIEPAKAALFQIYVPQLVKQPRTQNEIITASAFFFYHELLRLVPVGETENLKDSIQIERIQ